MSYPFIWDVLEGAAEWRIIAGSRLGQLLVESIDRVFRGACPTCPATAAADGSSPEIRQTFSDVTEFGLILNTALAGHLGFDRPVQGDFPGAAARARDLTTNLTAGGRLIFTNLRETDFFPRILSPVALPYIVIRDPGVRLSTAAALNANFPPVFSNAAVDVDNKDRYWVTDGGATDNRGLISLLLALKGAVRKMPEPPAGTVPPDIVIVAADASAGSVKYSQDRGIGTRFGASGKIANQLIGELLEEIGLLYREKGGRVRTFFLGMPESMRISGGLGTHWMLPRTVKLKVPQDQVEAMGAKELKLDAYTVRRLINELHPADIVPLAGDDDQGSGPGGGQAAQVCYHEAGATGTDHQKLAAIQEWSDMARHRQTWTALLRCLRGTCD